MNTPVVDDGTSVIQHREPALTDDETEAVVPIAFEGRAVTAAGRSNPAIKTVLGGRAR